MTHRLAPGSRVLGRLALALAIGAGGAALSGCQSDPTEADGDLAAALTDDNAAALVADGTSPTGETIAGMPEDDAGRIGWLLTEVDWPEPEADELGIGLRTAVADDPDLLAATLAGVADSADPVHPELRETVGGLLSDHTDEVAVALGAGDDDGLDRDDLLGTVGAIGVEPTLDLRRTLTDRMRAGLLADLPVPVPDGPPAVRAWERAYPRVYTEHVQPLVLLLAAGVGEQCGGQADDGCRAVVVEAGDVEDRTYTGVVNSRIPLALLPGRLADVLVTAPDGTRTGLVDDDLGEVWSDFRRREGYDLVELVLGEVGAA